MYDKSSKISKWASKNSLQGNDDNFYCVVQAIAAGVFQFVQSQVIRLNKEKQKEEHLETNIPKIINSTESLWCKVVVALEKFTSVLKGQSSIIEESRMKVNGVHK